MTGHP